MKTDKIRGEFDDYKYPFLNGGIDGENHQEIKEKKERAMAEAIELAAEPEPIMVRWFFYARFWR